MNSVERKLRQARRDMAQISVTSRVLLGSFITALILVGAYATYATSRLLLSPRNNSGSFTSSVLGDTTENNQDFNITEARYMKSGTDFFLRVSIRLKNSSQEVMQFSPLLQMLVQSASGARYPLTADYNITPFSGPIRPNQTVEGEFDFATGDDTTIQSLLFRTSTENLYQAYEIRPL